MLLGQLDQRREGAAHALVAGVLDAVVQEGHDRIDNGEAGVGASQGVVEPAGVGGEAPRPVLVVAVALPDEDARHVGAQAVQAGDDRVGGRILGTEHQGVGRAGSRLVVGERPARAEARAQVQRDQRLAQVRIAVQEEEFTQRHTVRPQPGHRLGDDLVGGLDRYGEGFAASGHLYSILGCPAGQVEGASPGAWRRGEVAAGRNACACPMGV
jgi:hypothetical protein